jgi:TatD DNase family protein
MIFDTHCHLAYDAGEDPQATWARARAAGVTRALNVGIDLATSARARDWARALDGVAWSAGLHPNHAGQLAAEWPQLAALGAERDCAAIGETGLDFYRDWTAPDQQRAAFVRHLELALELDKPVVVHCRDAFPAAFELLAAHPGVRGVMHCFSGGPADAERAIELGLHLSFAGPLTYPRSHALREVARVAPAGRVLVETDAPFLPPQDRRGQRNEPAFVVRTLAALAQARGVPFAEMAAITLRNAEALFGGSRPA